jgi:hypothetical protein
LQGFSSVRLKKTHYFAEERWKTIPFQGPRSQLDELVDVVLSIPEYIFLADGMVHMTSTFDLEEPLHKFRAGLSILISQLDNHDQITEEIFYESYSLQPVLYSDRRSGCLAAIRHAAYLVCFSLLAMSSTESEGNLDKAAQHSEAVLRTVEYVDTCAPSAAGSLYMSTAFSLDVLLEWSPSPIDKAYALQRWKVLLPGHSRRG